MQQRQQRASQQEQASPAEPDTSWLQAHSTPLTLPAGSIVLLPADCWHASGGNASAAPRRVFYAQFSAQPIAAPREESSANEETVAAAAAFALATRSAADEEGPAAKRQRLHAGDAGNASGACSAASPLRDAVTPIRCPYCSQSACASLLRQWEPLSLAIPCLTISVSLEASRSSDAK